MFEIFYKSSFKKDLKKIKKRGYDIEKLNVVINLLKTKQTLPSKYYDHELKGDYIGHRECHIAPDWLLIYKIDNHKLVLVLSRTGKHNDVFKNY